MTRRKPRRGAWCKQCQAPIRWVRTRAGSWMPLDESSDPSGRWIVEPGNTTRQLVGVELCCSRATSLAVSATPARRVHRARRTYVNPWA